MTDNKYERLKWKDWPEAPDLPQEKEVPLSKHPAELVTLMISTTPQGGWAWGYRVCWANGHTSYCNPTFRNGVFMEEREAILYGIGFMLSYAEYFQRETVENIKAAERRHNKTTLPLFGEP